MADDPFLTLLVEALNQVHPRFAAANGLVYTADEVRGWDTGPGRRKDRERSFLMEFYHQFRRLWDKALPVRLGLGHVIVQAEPAPETVDEVREGRPPDLLFWQLGEQGQPDRRLGAVSVAYSSNPAALADDIRTLSHYRRARGYPRAACVIVGRVDDIGRLADFPTSDMDGCRDVTVIVYDPDRRTATPVV